MDRDAALEAALDVWRRMHDGPLRVKVTIERGDGTELHYFYLARTVLLGDTVSVEFEVGRVELL